MLQNAFFLWTRNLPVNQKTTQRHPPSPFHGNFCNCNSTGICIASQFYVQLPLLYTAWSNAYSEIGPEVRCDLSRLLARKITKRIHSSKPASLNLPTARRCRPTYGHKPVLNWAKCLFAEHTSDSSTNYNWFLNWTFSSPKMVRTVRRATLRSYLAYNKMQASARTCGRSAADSMIQNVG